MGSPLRESASPPTTSDCIDNPNTISLPNPNAQSRPPPHSTETSPPAPPPRLPNLRVASDPPLSASMTASSTPLGTINAARHPGPPASSARPGGLPANMAEKLKAFHLSRRGSPGTPGANATPSPEAPRATAGVSLGQGPNPGSAFVPPHLARPANIPAQSAPAVPRASQKPLGGLAAKRGMNAGMNLADAMKGPPNPTAASGPVQSDGKEEKKSDPPETAFSKYSEFVDTKKGTLKFKNKATLHGSGIEFPDGRSISISLDEVETIGELGKGNYGTVYQVRHRRPQFRKQGMGLAGNKDPQSTSSPTDKNPDAPKDGATGLVMAMKEIRLELDEAKFAAIIMELDVLHRCVSPFIVDFYGAFFQEGAVYICMEFMDGGSIDKLYGDGMPENVLRKITLATTMGLKSLKDDHNIIHRDVKPTNILVNTQGQVKICDFGVSGNLVASIAKTNIGCQSYMAPERIAGGGVAQAGANPGGGTYSVQSDVWSLGLTIVECAMGRYPYPPETYNNIFSQLSAIVEGDPPGLPTGFSPAAHNFIASCLHKIPKSRPTYAMLLRHPWLTPLLQPPAIAEDAEAEAAAETIPMAAAANIPPLQQIPGMADEEVGSWVREAIEKRQLGKLHRAEKPALHAAPLDAVPSPASSAAM